ncbi:TetR/AcrR family transcriptional regulator [Nocardia transvalensis]|uniref:TetR/AcrR family transcriptional regulator n=1 Tax=Nocardia transvalensis TaxID=37333 RepID=UPI001892FF28|nr:TetR/AcrR family transcriptional regulator [Nocardia transvalensis]MBF6329999.1 TetR family transcriptional regulator [Nocardia transvalensis]
MSEPAADSFPTLWERRKFEAMARIQQVALDLFDEHGYREVTVERVAAAAGVSPSSVYRYFGTKEMLVLYDEADPKLLDVLRTAGGGEPLEMSELIAIARSLVPTVVEALVTGEAESRMRQSLQYIHTISEVRDGQMRQMREMEDQFRILFADRSGRDPNDLKVRMAAATAIWGGAAALDHWAGTGFARRLREVYYEAVGSIIDAIEQIFR